MNGAEQRARHTAVANAERRIGDLELVVVKLGEEILAERETFATHLLKQHDACQTRWEGTTAAIGAERTHRLTLANEQRAYVDSENQSLLRVLAAFDAFTFWERLRWLFRGAAR